MAGAAGRSTLIPPRGGAEGGRSARSGGADGCPPAPGGGGQSRRAGRARAPQAHRPRAGTVSLPLVAHRWARAGPLPLAGGTGAALRRTGRGAGTPQATSRSGDLRPVRPPSPPSRAAAGPAPAEGPGPPRGPRRVDAGAHRLAGGIARGARPPRHAARLGPARPRRDRRPGARRGAPLRRRPRGAAGCAPSPRFWSGWWTACGA